MMLGINPGLITAYRVTIGRLDSDSMTFNGTLREPVYTDGDGDGIGELGRVETEVVLDGQISTESWEQLRMMQGGHAPTSEIQITFNRDDLENEDLIDADTGGCLLRNGDRLISVHDEEGELVFGFDTDPAAADHRPPLKIVEARPSGFMVRQNLLVVSFSQDDRFVR